MPNGVPSTEWNETPLTRNGDSEKVIFDEILAKLEARIRDKAQAFPGHQPHRGFHAKIHAGVMGEFEVLDFDGPSEAKVGVFAEPAIYPTFVRFSNGQSDLQPDTKPQPRGIALKLVGVPGSPKERLDEASNAVTQDFLATSHSLTSIVRNVEQFFAVLEVMEGGGSTSLLGRVGTAIGHPIEAARLAMALTRHVLLPRVDSMATEYFSSTAPIKCGDFAIKFLIHPPIDVTAAPHERHADYLHFELADRLRRGDVRFEFAIQFFVDAEHTPIEDTSVEWSEHISPLIKVAELRIPQCDIDSSEGKGLTDVVDQLSFSPWHALEVHQPLGNVMRARRLAYPRSAKMRQFLPEPTRVHGGASLAKGGSTQSLRATVRV
jgi:hypothetical protein